jgi:hypothetical protein
MWAAINPNDLNISDIVPDKYTSIYDIYWVEWADSPEDFNKENIQKWSYTAEGIFVKKPDINTDDINNSKKMNITNAKVLIATTDWAVLPDVNLTETSKNNFITYREFLRNIIINPIEGHIDWPPIPIAEWTTT